VKSHLYAIGLDVNGDLADQTSYRDIAVRTKELNHMHVDSVTNDFREVITCQNMSEFIVFLGHVTGCHQLNLNIQFFCQNVPDMDNG